MSPRRPQLLPGEQVVDPVDGTPLDRLRSVFGAAGAGAGGRLGQVLTGYALVQSAVLTARVTRRHVEDRLLYTLTVRSDDPAYLEVHRWLLEVLPPAARRAVTAVSVPVDEKTGGKPPDEPVVLRYNDSRPRTLRVRGHRVRVQVRRNEAPPPAVGQPTMNRPDEIEFACWSPAGQAAVTATLEELVATHHTTRRPQLWGLSTWGSWSRRATVPQRGLDTVVLRAGQAERLLSDLRGFLAAEPGYARLGVPWHRGYLLHGPPGTGKTSVVRALASELGLDLWVASLGDVDKDTSLLNMVTDVRPRSILLLEDIDVWRAARERDAEPGGVSLSGLLNALDGVCTPPGLIVVMTTNRPDALEEALIRPGRVDVVEEFTALDQERLTRLFTIAYGQAPQRLRLPAGAVLTPADVTTVITRSLSDPAGAERELVRLLAPARSAAGS